MTATLPDIPDLLREQCLIDGAWRDAADGATIAVRDPADGRVIAHVPSLSAAETETAIEAARRALPA
ncbi:aldehyde dehydrogenase family protein, partial [Endobacter medicaginis]